MVLVTNNWRLWMVGMAASVVLFLILLFAVILPSQNTANNAIKSGLQQTQQALNQARHDFSTGNAASGSSASSSQAQQQASNAVNNASKLTACLASAGTDVSAVEACKTKYVK